MIKSTAKLFNNGCSLEIRVFSLEDIQVKPLPYFFFNENDARVVGNPTPADRSNEISMELSELSIQIQDPEENIFRLDD